MLYRNFEVCPHTIAKGLPGRVWKLLEQTPGITVSDGNTFHLFLFSGPDPIPAPSGGIVANRLAAQFSYVHDSLGLFSRGILAVLLLPNYLRGYIRRCGNSPGSTVALSLR